MEYLDRSSAVRAVRAKNSLKGNILKVDYCDSLGNPWISTSHRSIPVGPAQNQRSDRYESTFISYLLLNLSFLLLFMPVQSIFSS